jgi:hypothetical protein
MRCPVSCERFLVFGVGNHAKKWCTQWDVWGVVAYLPECVFVCTDVLPAPPPRTRVHHTVTVCHQVGFEDLEKLVLAAPDAADAVGSGRQELAEIYLDMAIK